VRSDFPKNSLLNSIKATQDSSVFPTFPIGYAKNLELMYYLADTTATEQKKSGKNIQAGIR
jgi:hypothetical protein